MTTSDFIDWLAAQLGDDPVIYQGPDTPGAEPRDHVIVTPVSGGSTLVDGYLEARVFQITTVGPMGLTSSTWNTVFKAAETRARQIDRIIVNAGRPVIGGEQVIYINRFGSTPQGGPTGRPLDAANRPSFQAMYVVESESNLYDI